MPGKDMYSFFITIVFPSILAISLFVLSIFVVIIPSYENSIMDGKKKMISELTNTAWSLLDEYQHEYINQNFSLEDAQKRASEKIEQIRYGEEYKDYFWIIDEHPTMIMHPYKSELISTDLINYKDPNGKKLFVEATKIVSQSGEGFIEYMWQWKDDSTKIVPKLSFVKAYKPWGWIIGTGIYLEDVKQEIKALKNSLLRVSLLITLIIALILSYLIHQSLILQNKRKEAESKLMLSRQKYKALVEASTEGTVLIINKSIIFSNIKFSQLSGYEVPRLLSLSFEDIFDLDWNQLRESFSDPMKSISVETMVKCEDGAKKEVILSVSNINYANDKAYILITKEITATRHLEKETEILREELQNSLLLMNQPVKSLIKEILRCSVETNIQEAALLMNRKKRDVLFVQNENEIIGVVNNADLKNRVLAKNLNTNNKIVEIMTSPVISIAEDALLYEAVLLMNKNNISHLATKNANGIIGGVLSYKDSLGIQKNFLSYLLKEIQMAENINHLHKIHKRETILVGALLESGDKTINITKIVSSISDEIARRIISLSIEELGPPPCEFAFMVMGSEGRMEQTLCTDQDNAIVFDNQDSENAEIASKYFQKLGEELSFKLNQVGYNYCKGGIMASNPKWTQSLDAWKKYFSDWVNTSDPQSILEASIFFDFRFVFGRESLISDLRLHVNEVIDKKSVFFYHLAQSIIKYKPSISLFGNLVSSPSDDHGHVDIKKILLPVIGFVRLYSLKNNLQETNTLSRINQLYKKQIINKSIYDELLLSYNFLMHLRFRFQIQSILENNTPDNLLEIRKLTQNELSTVKKIITSIANLQSILNFDFKGSMI